MEKILIITGSSKGIGRYLAEHYLDDNYIVIGCDIQDTDLSHERYDHHNLDISDEAEVIKMVKKASAKYKQIGYLINNAGIASMNHLLLTPYKTLEKVFKVNTFGTFLLCREVSKIMMKQKFGRIVNFTTVAVPLNLEGEAIYSASKIAIEQITRSIAVELSANGITCNAVGPAPIKTDLIKNVSDEKLERLLQRQAIHQFGELEDVANIIDFYFSEKSGMITGQTLYLGGVF